MTEQFIEEIEDFERKDRECFPPSGAVLFLGSSTFRLWSSLKEDFSGATVINRGFGGSQIEDSIRYVDRIVTPYSPRLIMFYAGDNDLASGKTPEKVSEDYQLLVNTVFSRLPRVRIVFVSIKPSPCRAMLLTSICKANSLIERFSQSDKRLSFANIFQAMLGPDDNPRQELFMDDDLHMNAGGYKIWKRILESYVIDSDSEQDKD